MSWYVVQFCFHHLLWDVEDCWGLNCVVGAEECLEMLWPSAQDGRLLSVRSACPFPLPRGLWVYGLWRSVHRFECFIETSVTTGVCTKLFSARFDHDTFWMRLEACAEGRCKQRRNTRFFIGQDGRAIGGPEVQISLFANIPESPGCSHQTMQSLFFFVENPKVSSEVDRMVFLPVFSYLFRGGVRWAFDSLNSCLKVWKCGASWLSGSVRDLIIIIKALLANHHKDHLNCL